MQAPSIGLDNIANYPKWVNWLVFGFAFILYANTIANYYNMDDELVTRNHRLTSQGISAIPEIFSSFYFEDGLGNNYEYRPLVLTSFAIEHAIFGDNPHISHLVNVILYGLLCLLIFKTMLRLFYTYNYLFPLLITLIFTAHPIHTEVVASIKNRDEILTLLFGILSLLSALKMFDSKRLTQKILWYTCILIFFLLALLTKRSIIPLALLIPLSLVLLRNSDHKTILALSIPLSITATLFTPLHFIHQKVIFNAGLMLSPLLANLIIQKVYLNILWFLKQNLIKLSEVVKWLYTIASSIILWLKKLLVYSLIELIRPFAIIVKGGQDPFKPNESPLFVGGKVLWFGHTIIVITTIILLILAAYGYKWAAIVGYFFTLIIYLSIPQKYFITYLYVIIGYHFAIAVIYPTEGLNEILFPLILAHYFFSEVRNTIAHNALLFIAIILTTAHEIYFEGSLLVFAYIICSFLTFYAYSRKKFWRGTLIALFFGCMTILETIISIKEVHFSWFYFFLMVPVYFIFKASTFKKVENQPKRNILATPGRHLHRSFVTYIAIMGVIMFTLAPDSSHLKTILTPYSPEVILEVINQPQPLPPPTEFPDVFQQEAPQVVPQAGRQLDFAENPLHYVNDIYKRVGTSFYTLGKYIQLLLFPHPLSFYYGYDYVPVVGLSHPFVIFSIVVHLLLIGWALISMYKKPLITYAVAFYIVSILPFSNLVVDVAGIMGERFVFVASLGYCILLAYLILQVFKINWLESAPRQLKYIDRKLLVSLAIIFMLMVGKTLVRNYHWKDNITLYTNDLEHLDKSAQAHNLMGSYLMNSIYTDGVVNPSELQQIEQAKGYFQKAVNIYPGFVNATFNLARTDVALGNYESALKSFEATTKLDSTYMEGYFQMALLLNDLGQLNEAIPYFEKTIQLAPDNITAYNLLSFIYFKLGEYQKSIETNLILLEFRPNSYDPLVNIGKTYMTLNQPDLALQYFEMAYEINSTETELYNNILRLRTQLGK